jgi:hypothetical protein
MDEQKREYRALRAIGLGTRVEAGETVLLTADEAAAWGPEYVELVTGEVTEESAETSTEETAETAETTPAAETSTEASEETPAETSTEETAGEAETSTEEASEGV